MSNPEVSDFNTLFPEQVIEIGGEEITIKELTFGQTMQLGSGLSNLVTEMGKGLEGSEVNADVVVSAFYEYPEISFKMLSLATDGKADQDFVEKLSDTEGYSLLMVFYAVHASFFGRRLLTRTLQKQELQKVMNAQKVDG